MRSQALKGRHNSAQGVNPVYGIHQRPSSPSTRQRREEGEEKKDVYLIGLTPYPMLCRPSRAIHLSSYIKENL